MTREAEVAGGSVLTWVRPSTHVVGDLAEVGIEDDRTVQFDFDR